MKNLWLFLCRFPMTSLGFIMFLIYAIGMLHFKIVDLKPEEYSRHAFDIRVTASTRYGYLLQHHGAVLASAPNLPSAAPPAWRLSHDDVELRTCMIRMLDAFPGKCLLEAIFFTVFWVFVFWIAPRASQWGVQQLRIIPRLLLHVGLWWTAWIWFMLPLLLFNYGASVFTTYAGPGAASWSGPYLGSIQGFAADTITYRPLVELFWSSMLLPNVLLQILPLPDNLPLAPALLLSGIAALVPIGAIHFLVIGGWRKREETPQICAGHST